MICSNYISVIVISCERFYHINTIHSMVMMTNIKCTRIARVVVCETQGMLSLVLTLSTPTALRATISRITARFRFNFLSFFSLILITSISLKVINFREQHIVLIRLEDIIVLLVLLMETLILSILIEGINDLNAIRLSGLILLLMLTHHQHLMIILLLLLLLLLSLIPHLNMMIIMETISH